MITPADSAPVAPGQMPASSFDIQAPYAAGEHQPIQAHGDADAGGRDDVAGTVAGAQAAAEARYREHQGDTYGQGSVIGDTVTIPASDLDPAVTDLHGQHPGGITEPKGAYYDPPRDYGGNEPS